MGENCSYNYKNLKARGVDGPPLSQCSSATVRERVTGGKRRDCGVYIGGVEGILLIVLGAARGASKTSTTIYSFEFYN